MERSTFLEYVACNTDMQALSSSLADTTITLGKNTARGLGAGGVPAVGRASAIDSSAEIEALVNGVDMVFVTAGMGGGTGSGAAPVVAELAKTAGCSCGNYCEHRGLLCEVCHYVTQPLVELYEGCMVVLKVSWC